MIGAAGVVLATGALLTAFQLRSARADLLIARSELQAVATQLGEAGTVEGRSALRDSTADAVKRTQRARNRIRGSIPLRVLGVVPGISTQHRGLVAAADVAASAARVGAELVASADRQADAITLRSGSVDLAAVKRLAAHAGDAGRSIGLLPRSHRPGQWGPLARSTRELDRIVRDAGHRLRTGSATLGATAELLGAGGPRRYLIALQNNAEMRDQGMVLSYAVASAVDGRLRIERSGRVTELALAKPITDVTLSPGTKAVFDALAPLQAWQSVNAFADSALSGRVMMSMFKAATGETVDGVIALDVPALAGLLGVTGPVTVAGVPEAIGAENAGRVLLNDLYSADPTVSQSDRRERLADVAAAVTGRLETSTIQAAGLARAVGRAAAGGHLRITSRVEEEQRAFVAAGLAGGPASKNPDRTIHVSVQNGTATKLDYFVDPRVNIDISITPDNAAVVRTRVEVPNAAPVPTPAGFQFGPDNIVQFTPGLYKARVYFWGPRGSDQLGSAADSGLNLSWGAVDVPAGQSGTVSFVSVIQNAVRDGVLRLRFVPQPRLRPSTLKISVEGIGKRVEVAPEVPERWDRTLDLTWKLSRDG